MLLDEKGYPFVVLEAKSEDKDPLDGKEQARRKYAQPLNARFIILSNGNLHYFWDLERGNPTVITSFPTIESLYHKKSFQPNPENLAREEIKEDYIVLTQNSYYSKDPRWDDEKSREEFIRENDLKFLRKYQLKAIQALQDAVKKEMTDFFLRWRPGQERRWLLWQLSSFFKDSQCNKSAFPCR